MKTISMWKKCWMIYPPPKIAREDLPLKSSVRFNSPTPPRNLKSPGNMEDLLLKLSVRFIPPHPLKLPLSLTSWHLKLILIN